MSDIITANYLTSSFLTEAVKQYVLNESALIGKTLLPVKETNASTVKIKVTKNSTKPIKDVASGASSPLGQIGGDTLVTYKPIEFREKKIVSGADYLKMVQYIEQFKNVQPSDTTFFGLQEKGAELARQLIEECALGVMTAIEKAIFNSLSGSLVTSKNGTISYGFDGARTPSAGTVWSTSATATPLDNLRTWVDLFRGSGYKASLILMNKATYNEMVATTQVKNAINGTETGISIQVNGRKITEVEETPVMIYDEGYINDSGVWTPYVPNDKVLIVGRPAIGGSAIGEFAMTPSEYNDLRPGMFINVYDNKDGDPKNMRIISGFNGLPVHYFEDGDAVVYAGV